MGKETKLKIIFRNKEKTCNGEFIVSDTPNCLEGFFQNYDGGLYIAGNDFVMTDYISVIDFEKFRFKTIVEDDNLYQGTTDFFEAKDFLPFVENIMNSNYFNTVDKIIDEVLEITKWRSTKESHPLNVRNSVCKFYRHLEITRLWTTVSFCANLNYDIQFSIQNNF